MDNRESLYTRLNNLEKRLEILEEFVLPRIEEEKRKKEEEKREQEKRIRKEFKEPLLDILWMKRILQKYYGCKLIGRDYITPEGKTWHINVPWGASQLSNRAESVGFKSYTELFDKEKVEKKLRLWDKLFNEEKIEKILDELEKAPMKDLRKIYDMEGYKKKLKVFKNRTE